MKVLGPPNSSSMARFCSSESGTLLKNLFSLTEPCGPPSDDAPLSEMNMTMVIVTHEMNFARAVADKVYFFDRGGIVESGTPAAFFEHPVTERGQKFLNSFIFNERRAKEQKS